MKKLLFKLILVLVVLLAGFYLARNLVARVGVEAAAGFGEIGTALDLGGCCGSQSRGPREEVCALWGNRFFSFRGACAI